MATALLDEQGLLVVIDSDRRFEPTRPLVSSYPMLALGF